MDWKNAKESPSRLTLAKEGTHKQAALTVDDQGNIITTRSLETKENAVGVQEADVKSESTPIKQNQVGTLCKAYRACRRQLFGIRIYSGLDLGRIRFCQARYGVPTTPKLFDE
jgi:hypothetical protein